MQHSIFEVPDDELAERRALIALSLVPNVGPGRVRSLIAYFGSAAEALQAPDERLARVPGIGKHTAEAIRDFDGHAVVDDQLERAERAGAELIVAWEDRFPAMLKEIYDPPAFIWLRGEQHPADERCIAVVGTRRATDYGRRVAFEFSAELARRGYTIISGLAHGIDTAAHRGALDAGGRTLAVLGSGVDRIYPASNDNLSRQIIHSGALISEYPLGAKPDAPNFPRRNRIVSGMALGTLVAESHGSGGALITARLALEQNREVFVVPGSLHSPSLEGNNQLIQKGYGKLVTSVDDILMELEGPIAVQTAAAGNGVPEEPVPELNPVEQQLYDALDREPIHLDSLCLKTGLDSSTALVYLLSLEFKGLVRQMAGKQFFRA